SPFKQKTAYEIGLGIPAEPLFRSNTNIKPYPNLTLSGTLNLILTLTYP
ncbi:unnamed protein product, partial [marine sediment metagenome]